MQIEDITMYYAHSKDEIPKEKATEGWQPLKEHLLNVSNKSRPVEVL
jgi:hypothetical protein